MEPMRAVVVEAERAWRDRNLDAHRLGPIEIAFGIVGPVLCLLVDPCVFKTAADPILGLGPDPTFPHWRAAAWAFTLLQCGALLAYVFVKPRRAVWHALFGGLFLLGALVAFGIGVVLAPMSLIGTLFMGIGLLGFIPFVTAIVFLRRGLHAIGRGRVWRGRLAPLAVLVGMAVGLGTPVGTWGAGRMVMRRALYVYETGTAHEAERATARLDRWWFLIYPDDLVKGYTRTGDLEARTRMAQAYKQLTGREIEVRLEEREVLLD